MPALARNGNGRNLVKFRNIIAVAVTAAAIGTAATACGSSAPDTYAPAAYGVPGYCYYIDSPAEAVALEAAGLCPSTWAPMLAPLAWQETYWDYYSSPAYYNSYVPAGYRTVYVQRETTFGRTYHTAIVTRQRTATYRSSSGKVVKGSNLPTGKARFGSGSAGVSHTSGSLRNGSTSGSRLSTGSGSSRSSSGGSSRSGSLRFSGGGFSSGGGRHK